MYKYISIVNFLLNSFCTRAIRFYYYKLKIIIEIIYYINLHKKM